MAGLISLCIFRRYSVLGNGDCGWCRIGIQHLKSLQHLVRVVGLGQIDYILFPSHL